MPVKTDKPSVVMVMRMVDGGRAVIGSIDCPHCGKEHLTVRVQCGDLRVYCGVGVSSSPDGWSWVSVETIQ